MIYGMQHKDGNVFLSVTNKTLEGKQQRHLNRYCGAGADSTSHACVSRNQPLAAVPAATKKSNPGEWSDHPMCSKCKTKFESQGMVA